MGQETLLAEELVPVSLINSHDGWSSSGLLETALPANLDRT